MASTAVPAERLTPACMRCSSRSAQPAGAPCERGRGRDGDSHVGCACGEGDAALGWRQVRLCHTHVEEALDRLELHATEAGDGGAAHEGRK